MGRKNGFLIIDTLACLFLLLAALVALSACLNMTIGAMHRHNQREQALTWGRLFLAQPEVAEDANKQHPSSKTQIKTQELQWGIRQKEISIMSASEGKVVVNLVRYE